MRSFNFNRTSSNYVMAALYFTVFSIVGCVSVKPPPQSGFLENYTELKQNPDDKSLMWWESTEFNWSSYTKVMIDPVTIYLHSDSSGTTIHPDELVKLADELRSAVVDELGQNYPVVSESGPGVLRVQAALTDIKLANVPINVVTTLVALLPLDMGGASIEVKFIDSMTGMTMATGMDQKLGFPTQVRNGFTSLGHARQSFKDWASELRAALETNP